MLRKLEATKWKGEILSDNPEDVAAQWKGAM